MNLSSLFEEFVPDAPPTEGIKYAGSKLKLLPHILRLARNVQPKTVFDGFAGTTRVSQAFAQTGCRVISNDCASWSKTFALCYLLNTNPYSHYRELIAHLNGLSGKDGWFTENYGGDAKGDQGQQSDELKKPWQKHNTRKLDAIREEIENLHLSPCEKAVAVTSLILALDEVDSTLGHFASYLKEWSPRSYRQMQLNIPRLIPKCAEHEAHQGDIFDQVPNVKADLAYYDPPYGSNNEKMPPSRVRYGAYYHVWTSICEFDKPELFGKARRRADTSDTLNVSVFEEFRKDATGKFIAVDAIERLLRLTPTPFILLSYSSGGRATACELQEALEANGRMLEAVEIDYKRNVMSGMRWTNEWVKEAEGANKEFLFLLEKR